MRTNFTQLPQIQELLTIVSNESSRKVEAGKVFSNLNLLDFKPLIELLEYLKINYRPSLFLNPHYDFLVGHKELDLVKNNLVDELSKLSYQNLIDSKMIELLDSVYDYLATQDEVFEKEYDIGFVFGSSTTMRIDKAIELYNQGTIKQIMISGCKPFYKDTEGTEAEILREYAITKGVKSNDIIIETQALTTPDNVKRTLDLFEKNNFYPQSIVLITSPFNMRRAYTNWLKFLPSNYSPVIIRCNSGISHVYSKTQWYKTTTGLNVVLNEYFKNRGEHLIDVYLYEMKIKTHLVDPNMYGIKSNQMCWTTDEARQDYNITDDELRLAGLDTYTILIHKDLINPLIKVNEFLQTYNLQIEIDDGFRSEAMYQLASQKVAQKKGDSASKDLFNLVTMPHNSGCSVDVALTSTITHTREPLFDKNDGHKASFLGYYEQYHDEKSKRFVFLQKLLGQAMLINGFKYGTKNEIWHFDYVGSR